MFKFLPMRKKLYRSHVVCRFAIEEAATIKSKADKDILSNKTP